MSRNLLFILSVYRYQSLAMIYSSNSLPVVVVDYLNVVGMFNYLYLSYGYVPKRFQMEPFLTKYVCLAVSP